MSGSNGVIRIGRKGRKKFAIGDEDDPRALPVFEVDVVKVFQSWLLTVDQFRRDEEDEDGSRPIPPETMPAYHQAAVDFVKELGGGDVETAEALDFLARLRECYNDLADFFQPKSRAERDSPATSAPASELRFSEEIPTQS